MTLDLVMMPRQHNLGAARAAGLVSDHLQAITPPEVTIESFQKEIGLANISLEPVEPTLEDVFLALSKN